jgi:hypothetical protein
MENKAGDDVITKPSRLTLFEVELKGFIRHFRKDDRAGSIFGKTQPRGPLDARRRAFDQILLPSNMDRVGIPRSGESFTKLCTEIVDLLHQESEEALRYWVRNHDEPIEFLADQNDPRVIEISRIAQAKLTENLQTDEKSM